jgi:hypothetical protein
MLMNNTSDQHDVDKKMLLKILASRLHLSYWTLRRYCVNGVSSRSGKTIKMKCVRLPGGIGSTLKSYEDFLDSLQK